MRTRRKTFLFSLLLAVFAILGVELAARAVLAFRLGPTVLVYGTRFDRQVLRPKALLERPWHERLALAEPRQRRLGTGEAGYLKYHPNQRKSGWDENGERYRVGINRHGFRGRDFARRKAPGIVRVVTLGASSTFGYHDRDDETYPHYLEQRLNVALDPVAFPGVRAFQVINLGIPHLDSAQILSLLQAEALPLDPDIVTFYEGINDTRHVEPPALQKLLFALSLKSVVAQLAQQLVTRHFTSFSEEDLRGHLAGKRERFHSHLERIHELCRARGIRFLVVSQQAKSNLVPREEIADLRYADEAAIVAARLDRGERISLDEMLFLIHAELMRGLDEWAAANGAEFVDGIRALDERARRDTLLSWVHLAPAGNRILAEAIADAILAGMRPAARAARPGGA